MASEKISAMPAATVQHAADVMPIVQSGNNLSVTREVFLRGETGVDLAVGGYQGELLLKASGDTFLFAENGYNLGLGLAGTSFLWLGCTYGGAATFKAQGSNFAQVGDPSHSYIQVYCPPTLGLGHVEFQMESGQVVQWYDAGVLGASSVFSAGFSTTAAVGKVWSAFGRRWHPPNHFGRLADIFAIVCCRRRPHVETSFRGVR